MLTASHTYRRAFPREQIEEFILFLAAKYPKTFFSDPRLKLPLKKNIVVDLERNGDLDNEKREAAINFYTLDWNYQRALQAGVKRVDLNGKDAGTVTETEAREAMRQVAAQKQERRERLAAERGPIETMRQMHSNGQISTDMLSKVTAPPTIPNTRPTMKPKTTTAPELDHLRTLLAKADDIVSTTDDANLRSALAVATLKVLITAANESIQTLEEATGSGNN